MVFGWKTEMQGSEYDRRKLTRRERISEELVDDPYEGTSSTSARDLEVLFEQVLALNNKYGTKFDRSMPQEEISNLQDLEDYIGACYNNYNANVEANKDDNKS
jgi:acyl carrier protein